MKNKGTKLVEFKNQKGEILRGLIDFSKSEKGVIFIHGLEGTTIAMHYKRIVDRLKNKVNLFRFDFSGSPFSDGKFRDLTVEKWKKELEKAVEVFRKEIPWLREVILVAHSLGGCVALAFLKEHLDLVKKIVFLAPAWNQKELLRYWFVKEKFKEKIEITWENFKEYLDEKEFQREIRKKKREISFHFLLNYYFLENFNKDYQDLFGKIKFDLKNVLIVHGENDDVVPISSNFKVYKKKGLKMIIVKKGNHDLEKPSMVRQYLSKTCKFILN